MTNLLRTRRDLAILCNTVGFKSCVEIGISEGKNAKVFCEEIPGLYYLGIDPYFDHPSMEKIAEDNLKKYNTTIIRLTSLAAESSITDRSFDFAIIDGSHTFENAMLDILLWTPKVKNKGFIICHDYYHFKGSGVIEAVNAYTQVNRINLHLTTGDPNSADDKMPSAWWVNI